MPRPVAGSSLVRAGHLYGRGVFIYDDQLFGYSVYYTVERSPINVLPDVDGWISIVILLER